MSIFELPCGNLSQRFWAGAVRAEERLLSAFQVSQLLYILTA